MDGRSIHFIGIGGAGMSGIAHILLDRGVQVSGSDLSDSERTERLKKRGATFFRGHAAKHLQNPDLVVVSSAIPPDNPEWAQAVERGVPVWSRGRMLAELTKGSQSIAVAGTHGKTTTASMIGYALTQSDFDPTVVVGAELEAFGSNARSGRGPYMVVEADESDRSFLLLNPDIAVITNIEEDHLENYSDIEAIEAAFGQFLASVPTEGLAVLCGDDPRVQALAASASSRVATYGLGTTCLYRGTQITTGSLSSTFTCYRGEKRLGTVSLRVPGLHNISNALAAVAVCVELGAPFEAVADALAQYRGAERRFEIIGEPGGILIVDDYAHHPTEIRATLEAARSLGRRVIAVFQPHRYSRTHRLANAFRHCFSDADRVIVTDIYAAGETPIEGVTAANLASDIERASGLPVTLWPERARIADALLPQLEPGDVVLTLGAGDIRKTALELCERLAEGFVVGWNGRAPVAMQTKR